MLCLHPHSLLHKITMKVHDTRSHEDNKLMTRKHKADTKASAFEAEHSKKPKPPENDNDSDNGHRSSKYLQFCKAAEENLSVDQMREILEANALHSSSSNDASVIRSCQDLLFYGPLENCPVCNGALDLNGTRYSCTGSYSEWSTCTFTTADPPRKPGPAVLPESALNSPIADLLSKCQDPTHRPQKDTTLKDKPFKAMTISLMGRLSRTHQFWRKEIEKHGGKVANSVLGASCLVASSAERDRGGTSKLAEALERGIPVVREQWLQESIDKQEPQPLDAYDIVSDLSAYGKGIPWDKQDPAEEALESLSAHLKMYGKRGVYKDTKLQEQGGKILDKDGLLYNCAFTLCDLGRGMNHYCIMQLVTVPEKPLHLYLKKGKFGDDPSAEERLEEWEDEGKALKEFARLFEEVTGNEFEPWERDKKIQKKPLKFFPIDMADEVEVRHGGLGVRQLGVAAAHTKLEPLVANFMKVMCSQEIYRYALMELGLDTPDLPIGVVTDLHLKRCEEVLLKFVETVKSMTEPGRKAEAVWSDFSQKWFSLMPSTRPFIFRDHQELAEHAASALETVRDITVASSLIGDMSGSTLDDPLSDRYNKLGCSVSPLQKNSGDYKMIVNYLEKTYEPVKVGEVEYGVSVDNIFAIQSKASPSFEEIKKLPNKILLWCGSRTSNMLRHMNKGFLPAVCSLPVPGYMFGKAIVCSDASAEAARYGFTGVDRPEGFLVLAVVSLGNSEIVEVKSPPEDTKSLEEKKMGVKGLGKKKPDESEHRNWEGDIKVPCGRLVPSEHKDSPLEYNEYAVYDPKQVVIRFLVGVKYEEKDSVIETGE